MRLKLYQLQVAAGFVCAVLLEILRHGVSSKGDTPQLALLELVSFGLCCTGIVLGGRSVRSRFLAIGSNLEGARQDPTFMRERLQVQLTAVPAVAAMASLLASRYGLDPFIVGLVALVFMAAVVPIANHLRGWRQST